MKKKINIKKINNKKLFNTNINFFFSGKDSLSNYLKIKSNVSCTKYDLKIFLYDIYGVNVNKVDTMVFSKKNSKKRKNFKNSKVHWLNYSIEE